MSEQYHYWDSIEAAFDAVTIYDGPEAFDAVFGTLPIHVQHLLAAHWFHSEHQNGGFHQFFSNSTGVLAQEAAEGLDAIGLTKSAAILRQAMERLGNPYPREREARMRIVGRTPRTGMNFEDLDVAEEATFGELTEKGDDFDFAADRYAMKFR